MTFWTKEKGAGGEVLDLRSENGDLQIVEEEWNIHEQPNSCWATQKQLDTGIQLTGACLKSSYLPYLTQIRLRQHSKISFLKVSVSVSWAKTA